MNLKSIGLMSGTSMDGIDAALMETDGKMFVSSISTASLEYSSEFKNALREAELAVRSAKKDIAPLSVVKKSTELHAKLIHDLLKKANLMPKDIDIIGYHGQSLYHNPKEKITIQVGDGQLLANLTNIKVINEFRQQDIANEGQGAPLAPLYHQVLATKLNLFPVAFVNCGGIANITLITGPKETQMKGFDTGPGNVLIDRYIRNKTSNSEFMDFNGKYGLKGTVNRSTLEKLMAQSDRYIKKNGPKSLDPGDFYLIDDLDSLSIYDACATLEAFTAACIVNSLKDEIPTNWVLAGGGWNNPVITNHLKQYLLEKIPNFKINTANEIGLDSTYMEAEIFAYLAVRSYYDLPISFPSTTGCKSPTLGGKLYIPQG